MCKENPRLLYSAFAWSGFAPTEHKFGLSDVVAGARCTGGLGVGYAGSGLDDQLLPGRPSRESPERSKSKVNSRWS